MKKTLFVQINHETIVNIIETDVADGFYNDRFDANSIFVSSRHLTDDLIAEYVKRFVLISLNHWQDIFLSNAVCNLQCIYGLYEQNKLVDKDERVARLMIEDIKQGLIVSDERF